MFWTYIILGCSALLSTRQAYVQWKKDHADNPITSKQIFYTSIMVLIFTAFAGGRQMYNDHDDSIRRDSLQTMINVKSDSLMKLQIKDGVNTSKIIKLQDSIIVFQRIMLNQITGGESKPYISIKFFGPVQNPGEVDYFVAAVSLSNKGMFPLRNIQGLITNSERIYLMRKGISVTQEGGMVKFGVSPEDIKLFNPIKHFDILTVAPNNEYLIDKFACGDASSPSVNFQIELQWQNGKINYWINLKREQDIIKDNKTEVFINDIKTSDASKFFSFSQQIQ